MRVALVCPYAWDRPGGVQSHVRALARALRRRGHEVGVLAPRARPLAGPGAAPAVGDGVTLVGRSVPIPANGSVAPLSFGPGAGAATRRALREGRADVVHLHEPLIPSVSLLALLNTVAPTLGTFHAAALRSLGYGVSRPLLERAARRLDRRAAVSEAARALVARYFPADYAITPNGVEVPRFRDAEPASWGAGRRILFVGRLEPRKGLDVLLRAMAELAAPETGLVVAGEGPEALPLRALARRLRLDVTWLGRLDDGDLARAYRRADVYCAPNSGGESFGIVLLEAMAAGAPVVCSDIAAFRAVAGEGARFVAPGDHRALARALGDVLAHPAEAERLRRAGARVARRFDWDVLAGDVENLYEECVAAARSERRAGGRARRDPRR
ncbi:MAG TPA: glycosyltransferase family 4 protein [Actinomycetota bacterium]|nr:glycosyltransferase family 4 protein [Actinomycetota bacterium]